VISVLTLNLLHDAAGWSERRTLVREWIELLDPDLIGFQEALRGEGIDQAAELLEGLGRHVAFGPATTDWMGRAGVTFGNVAASRWPIAKQTLLRLPGRDDGETRSALRLQVDAPVGPVVFVVTHLQWKMHHGYVRERQVVELCDFVLADLPASDFPPILAGDFNAEPESAEIRYLCGLQSLEGRSVHFRDAWRVAGNGGAGLTWSNRNPTARFWREPERRLDYVFVGHPRLDGVGLVEHCRVVCDAPRGGVWPSDHFGVYAELRSEAG
jgi:endonuclease/exonuclease/phosphatase family metal-dependent hydrolase